MNYSQASPFWPLGRKRSEPLSLPLYELMLSSVIQQMKRNVTSVQELEEKLHELGQTIGYSLAEIFFWKERSGRRDQQLLPLLLRIKSSFWKEFFGVPADALERSLEKDNEFMLMDENPVLFRNMSLPRDLLSFNPCAWIAGMLQAMITSCGFKCSVSAHRSSENFSENIENIVYLIQVDPGLLVQGLIE
ncbi:Trafficking protein particle complex subunit 31 [Mitosporidium daphniae]